MRTDRESVVIVVWVVLALSLLALALYEAIGGDVGTWLLVLVIGELILAALGKLGLRLAAPKRR